MSPKRLVRKTTKRFKAFFVGVPFATASGYGCAFQTQSCPPRSSGLGGIAHCKPDRIASIIILLFRCSPLAVIGRVALVVVLPFNRKIRGRRLSHISKEVTKNHPSFTNGNTSPSVARVSFITRIKTAVFHVRPYSHGRGFGGTVGQVSVDQTSATFSWFKSALKAVSPRYANSATITNTFPVGFVVEALNRPHYCQFVEFLPAQIALRVNRDKIWLKHRISLVDWMLEALGRINRSGASYCVEV